MVKRIYSGAVSGKNIKRRKTGIDTKWSTNFSELLEVDDGQGMMCSLCHKHSRHPKKAAIGRAIWVDMAGKSLVKQSLVNHNQIELRYCSENGSYSLLLQEIWWNSKGMLLHMLSLRYF